MFVPRKVSRKAMIPVIVVILSLAGLVVAAPVFAAAGASPPDGNTSAVGQAAPAVDQAAPAVDQAAPPATGDTVSGQVYQDDVSGQVYQDDVSGQVYQDITGAVYGQLYLKMIAPTVVISGETCSVTFSVYGGTLPYSFTESGALPEGVTFGVSSTSCYLSGIPATGGDFPVQITVTDFRNNTASINYDLSVCEEL